MVNKEMKFLDNGDIRYEIVDEAARTGLASKITSPTTSGTEGQVLTIDANGNPKWDGTSFIQVTDDGQGNISMETVYGVLIDTEPTENSENLVTSNGVYNAINGLNNIYFITATYDNNESAFITDKTFAQIVEAINNGKVPILVAEGQAWYWLCDRTANYLRFCCIGINNVNNYIIIQSNGNITFSTKSFADPTNYYTKTEIDDMIGDIGTLLASI